MMPSFRHAADDACHAAAFAMLMLFFDDALAFFRFDFSYAAAPLRHGASLPPLPFRYACRFDGVRAACFIFARYTACRQCSMPLPLSMPPTNVGVTCHVTDAVSSSPLR